jgi:carbon storage regulator
MLVLTRRNNESIVINGDIVITVLDVGRNGQVRLGIDAPRHYQIYRRELWLEIEQENRQALASALDPNAKQASAPLLTIDPAKRSASPAKLNTKATPKASAGTPAEPTPTGQSVTH